MNPPIEERPGDVLDGYHLCDRPLLVSYPRSGTNWIRYIIESLSDRPTPGQVRLLKGNNYVIDRAHCGFRVMDRYQKVILVLRDHRECILRQHQDHWTECANVRALLTDEAVECPASWYLNNLQAFDAHAGEKFLVYYEDLLMNPAETIDGLSEFLDFDPGRTRHFLKDIDAHYQQSVAAYKAGGHDSVTFGRRDLRHHARTKLTPEQAKEFEDFYIATNPSIARKYLSRYRADFLTDLKAVPMPPISAGEKRLRHILLSLDGRWLLDWTPRAASHGIIWTFLEANGLLAEAEREFPEGETRLHEYRFHQFYARHGYCSEEELLHSGRLRFKLVRNPYDRVVTSFLQLQGNRQDFEAHSGLSADDCTFLEFLEWLKAGNLDTNVHWMPQRQPFENQIGFWDFVIRAENIETDLAEINARWGLALKPPPRPIRHATQGRDAETSDLSSVPLGEILKVYPADYRRFYNATSLPLIETLFADDAGFYGYDAISEEIDASDQMNDESKDTPHPWFGFRKDQTATQRSSYYSTDRGSNKTYSMNSLGYRGEEYRADAKKTIVVAGCSFTFGVGLDLEETWGFGLREQCCVAWNVDRIDTNLLNLSEAGASNDTIARSLVGQCDRVKPDLAVVLFSYSARKEYILDGKTYAMMPWWAQPSAEERANELTTFGDNQRDKELISKMRRLFQAAQNYYRFYNEPTGLASSLRNMLLCQNYCAANQIPYLWSSLDDLIRPTKIHEIAPVLEPLSRCLDFSRYVEYEAAVDLASDELHPGPVTNRKFAERVFAAYQRLDSVTPPCAL